MAGKEIWDRVGEENSGLHGSDAKRGTVVKKPPRRKNAIRVNAMAIAHLVKALEEGCYSYEELTEQCGFSLQTARHYVKAMYKVGIVHIADWTEDKRGVRTVKVWALGQGDDAKKPHRITPKEACAKYRVKMKQIKLMQQMTGQNR